MAGILSPEHFIVLQGSLVAIGLILVVWRRPHRGMRLKLKSAVTRKMDLTVHKAAKSSTSYAPRRTPTKTVFTRPSILNIHFSYNGHDFDAYEVLGVPAGTSLEKVEIAYRTALEKAESSSREFLDAAFRAIQSHVANLSA
jgi:hypothetical protein